jgi:hypothetical protein
MYSLERSAVLIQLVAGCLATPFLISLDGAKVCDLYQYSLFPPRRAITNNP